MTCYAQIRGAWAATYETLYARYRTQLGRMVYSESELLHYASVDYGIDINNLSYVVAIMVAGGFNLDKASAKKETPRWLIENRRHHGESILGYIDSLVRYLRTAQTIKRLILVDITALPALRETVEQTQCGRVMTELQLQSYPLFFESAGRNENEIVKEGVSMATVVLLRHVLDVFGTRGAIDHSHQALVCIACSDQCIDTVGVHHTIEYC